MYRRAASGQHYGFCLVNNSTGSGLTSATVTAKRVIDNGTQTGASGTVTEKGLGQYNLAFATSDLDGEFCSFLFTASSAIPHCVTIPTTRADPRDGLRLGLSGLPNFQPYTVSGLLTLGTSTGQINPANGRVGPDWSNVGSPGSVVSFPGTTVGAISGLTSQAQADAANGVLARDFSAVPTPSGRSLVNAARFLRNRWQRSGDTLTVYQEDDSTSAWTAVLTQTSGAMPVSSIDPA